MTTGSDTWLAFFLRCSPFTFRLRLSQAFLPQHRGHNNEKCPTRRHSKSEPDSHSWQPSCLHANRGHRTGKCFVLSAFSKLQVHYAENLHCVCSTHIELPGSGSDSTKFPNFKQEVFLAHSRLEIKSTKIRELRYFRGTTSCFTCADTSIDAKWWH